MTDRILRPDGGDSDGSPLLSRRAAITVLGGAAVAAAGGLAVTNSDDRDQSSPPLPRLQVDGNLVTTVDGTPVTLRGVSIVDPRHANTKASIRGSNAVGMVNRVTNSAKGWEPSVVRIPVQPTDIGKRGTERDPKPVAFTREQLRSYLKKHLDPVVERCAERGVYAIIDFHRHRSRIEWGDQEAGTINQPLQEEAIRFWDAVAPRYAEEDHVIYEMFNEPTEPGMWGSPEEDWVKSVWYLYLEFAQPIVDTIRSHTDTLVLVGSPSWSQSPEGALIEPVDGGNIAYTYHIYPGHEVSQEGDWEDASINGEGVERVYEEFPLFVTEFGWRDTRDRLYGGTTSEFGEPFFEWLESSDAISWTAWCADVWWEPKLFTKRGGNWRLLGRKAGTLEDAGEYVRQALEAEGVPEDYWETDGPKGRRSAGRELSRPGERRDGTE